MKRILKPAIAAIAVAGALAACSNGVDDSNADPNDDTGPPAIDASAPATTSSPTPSALPSTPATATTITIENFDFGEALTVAPGTTVTVVNEDAAPHNVTTADEAFRSPDLQQGQTGTFVAPTEPGTYDLVCTFHPQMSGQLIVSATAASTTNTATSTPAPGGGAN